MSRAALAIFVVLGAASASAQTTVTMIDTTGDVGAYASLAIGSDGLGLVAYNDSTNGDLRVAHCSNVACTSATLSTIDSAGLVGLYASLAIGPDGRGIIAYYDFTLDWIKTAHCNDVACTSATIRLIAGPASLRGLDVTIGSDGLPLLLFIAGPQLYTAHCSVPDCSSVALYYHGTAGTSRDVAVGVGTNGLGLLALERRYEGNIDVRRCENVACSVSSPAEPPVPGPNVFIQPRSMVVPPDGRPLIGYFYANFNTSPSVLQVRMNRCADATCLGQTPSLSFDSVSGPDIALQANGLPWFAYAEDSGRLALRRCTDAACSSPIDTCVPATAALYVSLARLPNDRPLIAFYSYEGGLGVAYDISAPCTGMNIGDVTVTEAAGAQATFLATLTQPTTQTVTVDYATIDGTATFVHDYATTTGTLTFAPGMVAAQVPVAVLADGIDEPSEFFQLQLSNAAGAFISDGQAIGTILDADPPPRIVAGDCNRVEGDTGPRDCIIPVTLQGASAQAVSVAFATADGTATAGADYVASSGTVTFPPYATSGTVPVPVLGDSVIELDETFAVNLSGPLNATILDGTADGLILDDDAPSLSSRELTHGARVTADLAAVPGPAADVDFYRLAQGPYSSWEVVVDEVSGDVAPGLLVERLAEDNSTVLQTGVASGTGPARALRWERRAGTPEVRQHIRVGSTSCTTDCGADDSYRLRAYETTGAIPRFNNSSTQVTVLVLQNATDQPVQAHADFWSASGVLLTSVSIPLAPHAVGLVNTATLPALAGTSGSITVTHNGPYAALAGKSVALEPATGFSFDSPMGLKPR